MFINQIIRHKYYFYIKEKRKKINYVCIEILMKERLREYIRVFDKIHGVASSYKMQ